MYTQTRILLFNGDINRTNFRMIKYTMVKVQSKIVLHREVKVLHLHVMVRSHSFVKEFELPFNE